MMSGIAEQIAHNPTTADDDWIAAERALEVAQELPAGIDRFEALKRAGQLRNKAADRLEAEGRYSRRPRND
jgi:hypothetical protein